MQMSFDFAAPSQPMDQAERDTEANDYHRLPASEKQQRFAMQIAQRLKTSVPGNTLADRQKLAEWIDAHKGAAPKASRFANYPSSKQVAFAERIARIKRRAVPDECFRDRKMMSRWIDSNR